MLVYLNGSYLHQDDAKVHVSDRGFLFGDGVYEVFRVVHGEIFREQAHLERLNESLDAMGLDVEKKIRKSLPGVFRELIERNNLIKNEATIYLQITRGAASPRTHPWPDPAVEPTIFVASEPFSPHLELQKSGIRVITMADLRWARCNIKSVNLLPNTMARQRALEAGVQSAILIRDGVVTESPNANIFGVQKNRLITYPATNYLLEGITRGVVLEIAMRLNVETDFTGIREEDLFDLDEIFFTGTSTDIQPVVEIDEKPVNSGKPGPVTAKIQQTYHEALYENR